MWVQTCVSLAVVRNIAYYTNFWSLMAICWTLLFIITPMQSTLGAVLSWTYAKTTSLRQVRSSNDAFAQGERLIRYIVQTPRRCWPSSLQADFKKFHAQVFATKLQKTWTKLDRLSKVFCIAISALAAAYISDSTSKGFLVLTFLMFVRCFMKAKEVWLPTWIECTACMCLPMPCAALCVCDVLKSKYMRCWSWPKFVIRSWAICTTLLVAVLQQCDIAVLLPKQSWRMQVKAVRESTIVRSVASSHMLRSAFKATERAGSFADDVLMSAMKSARKQLVAHED
jgi:hypothetical protein